MTKDQIIQAALDRTNDHNQSVAINEIQKLMSIIQKNNATIKGLQQANDKAKKQISEVTFEVIDSSLIQ